jgi:D-arabinose 1-dehydrogenase-like Zn-dependent alcohol dehydrogenase/uncharacterized protein (UPF0276 family)
VTGRPPIHVGLELLPAEDLRVAALPLFEEGLVDALEWSVDFGFGAPPPAWAEALLRHYGEAGRLLAHGVELSALTADQDGRRRAWLDDLRRTFGDYAFVHLSEHLGIMTAGDLVGGTPLPHPFCAEAVELGIRRLEELREAVDGAPVGLENLALALSPMDVEDQPAFLEALLAPVDGFLLLDLHNLLCQAENYGVDPQALLDRQPLHRVRQLHLAGGTHWPSAHGPFRRDDHARATPEACFPLLKRAVRRCPELRWVIVEHSDGQLRTTEEVEAWRRAYRRIRDTVEAAWTAPPIPLEPFATPAPPALGGDLASAQRAYLGALRRAGDPEEAREALATSRWLDPWRAWTESMAPSALELAVHLLDRWGEAEGDDGRAFGITAPGVLGFRDVAIPAPGPGEVRLAVRATGVCGTDLHLADGLLPAVAPLTLGHETVGVVEAVGDGVDAGWLGRRVGVPWHQGGCGACQTCDAGRSAFCPRAYGWPSLGGGFAPLCRARADALIPIPRALPDAEAAPLLCAGATVAPAVEGIRPGETLLVAGLGGLGHLAVQRAAAAGVGVAVRTGNPTKVADAKRLGAADTFVGAVPEAAFDHVLHTGGPFDATLLRALRPGGRLLLAAVGADRWPVAPDEVLGRQLRVEPTRPAWGDPLRRLLAEVAVGGRRPWVEAFPRRQARRVFERLRERRVRYRAVLLGPG